MADDQETKAAEAARTAEAEQAAALVEQETQKWRDYIATKDQKIRDYFAVQYAPLVKYVAGKVAVAMPHSVEYDDLVGFGTFGLLDAIEKFDPDKKVKFKTYAVTRIRGAIFDGLRSIDMVPRSIRQKAREIEGIIGELESHLGRTASDSEIAAAMGISESEYTKTLMKISATSVISINDVWYAGDDSDRVSVGDTIESPASLNPDVQVEREEIRQIIIQAIKELPDKEKKVLVLYYYEDQTLKEIGKILDVTESRVSQLHTRAILRLRGRLTNARKGII
ncbi:MAG: RNA polymerase sigma factor WhiG [Spirochaetaceae bacterium]|jgi:RNA polymerase sigma factor for flagellar operon FliA|nr:RNA polymerase sigma factor WhiG [Spirochaetaceae bacterium]